MCNGFSRDMNTRETIEPNVGKHPYQRVRVADLNGDGRADIVSPNLEGDNVTILLGDGTGKFRQPAGSPFPCGDSPFNVAIGDAFGPSRLSIFLCLHVLDDDTPRPYRRKEV